MKLDKESLRKIIVETLQEVEGDVPPEQVAAAAQDPDRVRSMEPEGITPESFNDLKMSVEEVKEMLKQLLKKEERGV